MIVKYIKNLFPFKLFDDHVIKEIYKNLIPWKVYPVSQTIKQEDGQHLNVFIVFKGKIKHFHRAKKD